MKRHYFSNCHAKPPTKNTAHTGTCAACVTNRMYMRPSWRPCGPDDQNMKCTHTQARRTKQKTDLSQIMEVARVNTSTEAAQVAGRIQSLFTAHQITKDMSERTAPRAGGAFSSPARSCRAEEAAARAMSSPLQPPFVLCACRLSGRQNQLAPW